MVVCVPGGCMPGGCLPSGVSAWGGGVSILVCNGSDTPPVNKITDRCKDVTLPQTSFAGSNNGLPPS